MVETGETYFSYQDHGAPTTRDSPFNHIQDRWDIGDGDTLPSWFVLLVPNVWVIVPLDKYIHCTSVVVNL